MLFAVLAVQKAEIDQYCFRCKHMLIGMLVDERLGGMLPCRHEQCPHETMRMTWGEVIRDSEVVVLRKLEGREINDGDTKAAGERN